MISAHHRLIPLHNAIAEFGLEALFRCDGGYDAMEDTVSLPKYRSSPMTLVFDGDTRAVLTTAGYDDPDRADYVSRNYACVQTWFMGLGHLNWREDSGSEFCEDVEYADQDHLWKTDSVWLRSNGIDDALGACA